MTARLDADKAKHAKWVNEASWQNCKLQRGEYGNFLASYITGERNGFVLNLDGCWGTGKTEFLKRFYVDLLGRGHPVVYIDAWESDFSKEPLMVIASELLSQIRQLDGGVESIEGYERAAKLIGGFLKGTIVGLAACASRQLTGDGDLGKNLAENFVNAEPVEVMGKLSKEYEEQVDSLRKIRSALSDLASDLKIKYQAELPVVVLIDELDRCRPSYAVEMLEVVKHFFQTPGLVFVVASDTSQLTKSISVVYGVDFDSKGYLKRFFNRTASLEKPDVLLYLNALEKDFEVYDGVILDQRNGYVSCQEIIAAISDAYSLELRDVDQVVDKILAILRQASTVASVTSGVQLINFFVLTLGVIEHHTNSESFFSKTSNIRSSNFSFSKLIKLKGVDVTYWARTLIKIVTINEVASHGNYGASKNYYLLNHEDMRIISNDLESQIVDVDFHNYIGRICNNIRCESNFLLKSLHEGGMVFPDRSRHWLWADYKKMIELSGNLS